MSVGAHRLTLAHMRKQFREEKIYPLFRQIIKDGIIKYDPEQNIIYGETWQYKEIIKESISCRYKHELKGWEVIDNAVAIEMWFGKEAAAKLRQKEREMKRKAEKEQQEEIKNKIRNKTKEEIKEELEFFGQTIEQYIQDNKKYLNQETIEKIKSFNL